MKKLVKNIGIVAIVGVISATGVVLWNKVLKDKFKSMANKFRRKLK